MAVVTTLLAMHGDFQLYERTGFSAPPNGWTNLKLIRIGRAKKNNWWFGWNGERLANTADYRKLMEHQPEIAAWVIGFMASRPTREASE